MTSDEAAAAPIVTDDGSATLYSLRYRQSYHSRHGALSEARHVFLDGSGVAALLASAGRARVLEVGFGTGLNFLVTADHALRCGAELHYVALERKLPSARSLGALEFGRHLEHPHLFARLLAARAGTAAPAGRWRLDFGPARLELRCGDARDALLEEGGYDAVYHDAFSPDVNPELWGEDFLARLHRALAPGGRLATYTVKGEVRRRLQGLGFAVAKRPGPPGGKREVLVARREAGADPTSG